MEIQVEGLPESLYDVELVSMEELPPSEDHLDWGPRAAITVMVVSGSYDGTVATDLMGKRPGTKARFGKLLRGIVNRAELAPGERINLSEFFGRRYKLTTEIVDGKSRFAKLLAIPDPAPPKSAKSDD